MTDLIIAIQKWGTGFGGIVFVYGTGMTLVGAIAILLLLNS